MAGVPIADSMKVTVLLLQNVTGESMQFGFRGAPELPPR